MKKTIMKVDCTVNNLKKMARLVSDLEYKYIKYVYTNPGHYKEHHSYGKKTVDGRKVWYVEWEAWEIIDE